MANPSNYMELPYIKLERTDPWNNQFTLIGKLKSLEYKSRYSKDQPKYTIRWINPIVHYLQKPHIPTHKRLPVEYRRQMKVHYMNATNKATSSVEGVWLAYYDHKLTSYLHPQLGFLSPNLDNYPQREFYAGKEFDKHLRSQDFLDQIACMERICGAHVEFGMQNLLMDLDDGGLADYAAERGCNFGVSNEHPRLKTMEAQHLQSAIRRILGPQFHPELKCINLNGVWMLEEVIIHVNYNMEVIDSFGPYYDCGPFDVVHF